MTPPLLPVSATPLGADLASIPHSASYPRLVADIGGTHARFGWLAGPGLPLDHVRKLTAAAYAGPVEAVRAYLQQLGQMASASHASGAAGPGVAATPPRRAAFAVATPVERDEVRFTNSAWRFSRKQVEAELGLDSLLLLNDFEALALSLPCLTPAQRRCWGAEAPRAEGTLAVVGPGTGLGVGAVVATRCGWVALPGEGGHASLPAADALESALLAWVRQQHGHVSAERLLSGMGLPLLYRGLAAVSGRSAVADWPVETIVEQGLARTDALASDSLDLFCALLGGFAGNVALTLGARSGLYIGGGIVPRLGERFFQSAFRERFEAKGRFRAYLQAIPTALITDTHAALAGAALAIAQHAQPPAASA